MIIGKDGIKISVKTRLEMEWAWIDLCFMYLWPNGIRARS